MIRTRNVVATCCLVAAMYAAEPSFVNARPADVDAAVSSPAAPTRAGIGGTGFRRVADVIRAAASARGPVASSLDPQLAALADDSSAYIDSDGRLLYIEQFDAGQADGPPPAAPEIAASVDSDVAQGVYLPPGNTFLLNSRPGSTKTIFLDFDGYNVTGTAWNAQTGVGSRTVLPYDYDGIAGRSATDEQYIRAIWQAVADDYAAFDVNVTTQQPSDDALYRLSADDSTYGAIAVITPDRWMPTICGDGCGGVAYVNVFGEYRNAFPTTTPADRYYAPAWVFALSLSSWTFVADTISHEVGHNLGLSHDGLANTGISPCFTAAPYFGGNGSGVGTWGPIMGAPFGRQYSQWSRGEYNCANQFQDDVAIIGAKTGFGPDESTGPGNAVAIPTTEFPTSDQVIGFAGDVDYFAINVTTGYLRAILTRTTNASSLLPRFAILNSGGAELTAGFLTSSSSGYLELSSLAPGTYYVSVTGAGFSSPQLGFSNYASFGYYNVAATLRTPTVPGSPSLTATGNQVLTATWSASTSLTVAPITYAVTLCEAATTTCQAPIDTTTTSVDFTAPTPTGSYFVRINARHTPGGVSPSATSAAVSVLTAPVAPAPIRLVFSESTDTVTVVWGGEQQFSPVTVTGRTLTVVRRDSGATIFSQSVGASGSLNFTTALVDIWLDASLVSQTAYGPPWNTSVPSPIGSVYLGRLAAPQVPGTTVAGRPAAPQTPGSTVPGRPSAPQA